MVLVHFCGTNLAGLRKVVADGAGCLQGQWSQVGSRWWEGGISLHQWGEDSGRECCNKGVDLIAAKGLHECTVIMDDSGGRGEGVELSELGGEERVVFDVTEVISLAQAGLGFWIEAGEKLLFKGAG